MKITLKRDAEKLELLKAMASNNADESFKAQVAIAKLFSGAANQVLNHAATSNLIYETTPYTLGDVPSVPVEMFYGNTEGLIDVWSQGAPGGLGSSLVSGNDEFRATTWTLMSAVHMLKSFAQRGRLDVVSAAIERMLQELLVKQEYFLWETVLKSLGNSRTNGALHLIDATTAGTFQVDDLNRLWTFVKRLRTSWVGGTPVNAPGRGLTDIFVSPEVLGDIRAMSYNPQNTRATPDTAESTALGLPDAVREEIYRNAGTKEIFGVRIHELVEFGVGQIYNLLFDAGHTASGGDVGFDGATDELVLGVDLSVRSAIKFVAEDSDYGDSFVVQPDDQWVARSKKIGWWTEAEMGNLVADTKAFSGLVV